jgi:uncharacterized protein YndB with AHSA1/START domain
MSESKAKFTAEPGQLDVTVEREFNAPRERVFAAYTDANAITKWWGPRRYTTTVDKLEAKPGGIWRFVQQGDDNKTFAFRGVFHESRSPEVIVQTFEFEGAPGHVILNTMKFEDLGNGRTKLIAQSVFQTREARDQMQKAGAQKGGEESYDRLDELLARARSK